HLPRPQERLLPGLRPEQHGAGGIPLGLQGPQFRLPAEQLARPGLAVKGAAMMTTNRNPRLHLAPWIALALLLLVSLPAGAKDFALFKGAVLGIWKTQTAL